MALYFLEYDLIKIKNYQPLYDELQRIGAVKHLFSSWSFKGEHPGRCKEVLEHFRQFVDADDRLMVIEVTDWVGVNLLAKPYDT